MNSIMSGSLSVAGAQPKTIRKAGGTASCLIAALICVATMALPNLAFARGGGGGFHGGGVGGFHAGGGGFHAAAIGGFHGGGLRGFHGAGVGERSGEWQGAWHNGRYGDYRGWGNDDPYVWSDDGLYGGDDAFSTTYASQYWYCADPAGYYPHVTQCRTSWQLVPAG